MRAWLRDDRESMSAATSADVELARRITRAATIHARRQPGEQMSDHHTLLRVQALVARDGWGCAYCGVGLVLQPHQPAATVDHVMPKARGGNGRALTNMVLACQRCNSTKGQSLPIGIWRPRIDRSELVYSGPKVLRRQVLLDWARPG